MSGVHFGLACTVDACEIRDLNSRNGTLLNGQKITHAVLRQGDSIVAGETVFLLQIQGEEAAIPETGPVLSADATPHDRLLHMFRQDFQPLYAILDAARDIKIFALLLKGKDENQSLYEGQQGAKLAQVAPYLVRLKPDSHLLETLVREGWGQSWGVYLTCPRELQEVRQHFRHFLEVQMPDGKQVYFRFYDPRVLRVFLANCTRDDTAQFFGPIQSYLIEGECLGDLYRFVNTGKGSERTVIAIDPNAKSGEATSTKSGPETLSDNPRAAAPK